TTTTFQNQLVGMVQLWDAANGRRIHSIQVLPPVTITGAIADAAVLNRYPHIRAWALNERYLAVTKSLVQSHGAAARLGASPLATPTPMPTPVPTPTPLAPLPALPSDEATEIWDLVAGTRVSTLDLGGQSAPNRPTAPNTVDTMLWVPDGARLAVHTLGQSDNQWQLWDVVTGKRMRTFPAGYESATIAAWSVDGRLISLGTAIDAVETGRQVASYAVDGMLVAQAWSLDGQRIAASSFTRAGLYASTYAAISVIDTSNGRRIARYDQGQIDPVSAAPVSSKKMAWSPN